MNDLNNAVHESYVPQLAIVVYNNGREWGDDSYYLESHAIDESGHFLEGRPLKAETIAGIVQVFKDRHQQDTRITGVIPPCMLYFSPEAAGDYSLIWHRPACQKMLYFTDEVKLKSGLAHVPPVLFVASTSHLRVFTLPSAKRPNYKTKVYAAPFLNISSDGRVCLGSAKVKQPAQKTFENLIAYWEEMFWGSKFSAVHNDEAVQGDMLKLWREQLRRPSNPFPMHLLAQSNITFQSLTNGRQ